MNTSKWLLSIILCLVSSTGICEEWTIRGYVDRSGVGYEYKADVLKLKSLKAWQKGTPPPFDLSNLIKKVDAYIIQKYGDVDYIYEEIELNYRKYKSGKDIGFYWLITFDLHDTKRKMELLPVAMLVDGSIIEPQKLPIPDNNTL
ncbi:hypothetical protein ACFSW8_15190 [Rubritalea tangerina]|uniref:Uncharacterized protein n=1 Tax=Rubritalea tangerina TaxID=430798 RepID=A0ABW4ZFF3_9BACT